MSETTELHAECCVIGCNQTAVWRIRDGEMSDEITDACTLHVGELLQNGKISTVYEIVVEEANGLIIDPVAKETTFPNRYPQVPDFVASFEQTEAVPDCAHCRLDMKDPLVAPCFDCNGHVKTGRSYYRPKCYPVVEEPKLAFTINATGLPEFDRLLNVLTTIHMMSDDPRIKAFIEVEAAQVPGTPLAHTFDLLNKAGELTFDPVSNSYIAEALAALDDAKQCVAEDAEHFVVLDTLHKYLDGLVGKRIDTVVTLQTEM